MSDLASEVLTKANIEALPTYRASVGLIDAIFAAREVATSAQRKLWVISDALSTLGMDRPAQMLSVIGDDLVEAANRVSHAHGIAQNEHIKTVEANTGTILSALVASLGVPQAGEAEDVVRG